MVLVKLILHFETGQNQDNFPFISVCLGGRKRATALSFVDFGVEIQIAQMHRGIHNCTHRQSTLSSTARAPTTWKSFC